MISFFPGAAAAWFWVAAAGAALGMLSANRRVRVAAVVLVLVFTAQGWGGYQDGLRYEEYMKERDRQPAKS